MNPLENARIAAMGLLVLASASCATGKARVESRKSPDYDKKIERVLVVFPLARLGSDFERTFQVRFVAELKRRGAEARFALTESTLAVEPGPSLEKQAKDFGASSALLMVPTGGVVDSAGGVIKARFDGQLIDVARNKRVWRAQVEFQPGAPILKPEQRADVLINEVIAALVADGLVQGGPPEAPKAAAEASVSE